MNKSLAQHYRDHRKEIEHLKQLLRWIVNSPVDLVNDGEHCMRIKSELIEEAKQVTE